MSTKKIETLFIALGLLANILLHILQSTNIGQKLTRLLHFIGFNFAVGRHPDRLGYGQVTDASLKPIAQNPHEILVGELVNIYEVKIPAR